MLGNLGDHLSRSCVFVLIECPNECGLKVLRKYIEEHTSSHCAKRMESCSYCTFETTNDSMNGHLKICGKVPVSCPRDCEEELLRDDLKEHEEVCPNMSVKCPFYDAGCTNLLLRKELSVHVETATNSHLMNLMASHSMLKANYGILEANYSATKQELADLKSVAACAVDEVINRHSFLHNSKPLASLASFLKPNELNSVGDCLTFALPEEVTDEWESPVFLVNPGYKLSVVLTQNC